MVGSFGVLLRRLRIAANLSQETLAERAHISSGAIGAYERGIRSAPHRETVAALGAALDLTDEALADFKAAARRVSRAWPALTRAEHCVPPGNLPVETTSFIGREHETAEIDELLRRHRIVTITGAGGIGKTRVALAVAARFRPIPRSGAWVADLSAITQETLIRTKVGTILGVPPTRTSIYDQALVRHCGPLELLLVLDNCEHVLESAGMLVAGLLKACPKVMVLVTSRERLRISGEVVYRLASLAAPVHRPESAAEALRYAAIELFVERGARADRQFGLTDACVPAVADICRRLDGLPLAIELAAARLPHLGLRELCERLTDSLATLSFGARDLPIRQRALAATLDWSYSLLHKRERLLLQRLSVFRGGSRLDAVEAVCADENVPIESICDCLSSLVDKSLVVMEGEAGDARYTLLQTTQAFAAAKLREHGDSSPLYRRYAQWWAAFANEAEAVVFDLASSDWVNLVYPELENIDRAVEWASGPGGDELTAARIRSSLPLWTHLRRFMREKPPRE